MERCNTYLALEKHLIQVVLLSWHADIDSIAEGMTRADYMWQCVEDSAVVTTHRGLWQLVGG